MGSRPGWVWLVHNVHGGGAWFPDSADVRQAWGARGWEEAPEPVEDEEEILPESPAPKKETSKAAESAAAEKE